MRLIKRKLVLRVLGVLPCLGTVLLFAYSPAQAQTSAGEAEPATVQVSGNSGLGEYLTDGEGRTLYFFAADSRGASNCYDFCANTFPAYTIEGRPTAGEGAVSSRLGTLKRKNGDTQVTYAGHPLYYFVADIKPDSTAGDGAKKYGAVWSAIAPDGKAAEATAVAKAETGDTDAEGAKSASPGQVEAGGGNPFAGDAQAVVAGEELYSRFGCYGCHGRGGGGGMGPSLIDSGWSYGGGSDAALFKTITQGRPKGMPAFGQHLNEEQVWKIVAFLRSISNAPQAAK